MQLDLCIACHRAFFFRKKAFQARLHVSDDLIGPAC